MELSDFNVRRKCRHCEGSGRSSDIDHQSAGLWIWGYRKRAGLTLREVARRLGCSVAYLNDLEHGRRNWNEERLNKTLEAMK